MTPKVAADRLNAMRVVLQRVIEASVGVEGETIASIGRGLLLLVGAAAGDDESEARRLAQKCAEMRVFSDDEGRFNLSLLDIGGEALVVSQFTLLADVRRGRRPSFVAAAEPGVHHARVVVEAGEKWESPEAISKELGETDFWFSTVPSFPRPTTCGP